MPTAAGATFRLFASGAPSTAQQPQSPVFDVTAASFQQSVLRNALPVVLDCYADWCGPCRQLTPLLREAVERTRGKVALGLLDTDREPELADSLQIKSLPTVFGVVRGRVSDHFTGGQAANVVDAFVARLAEQSPAGNAEGGEPNSPAENNDAAGLSAVARAEKALEDDDGAAAAAKILDDEYAALQAAAKPAHRRGLSKEFDEKAPDSAKIAAVLEARGRCAVHARDVDAARATLTKLRDPKRAAVLDRDPALNAAVARLALAIDDLDHDASADNGATRLAAARAKFASGDAAGALDDALALVVDAETDDDRDDARKAVLAFIDALGAKAPEAVAARKRLANALFR